MRSWSTREGKAVVRRSVAAGGPVLAVDSHPKRGYLVRADGFGAYLISADGQRALLAPGRVERWRWQLLLTAQVLPLAALIHGLELLHASAVRLNGRVLAFAGASGTGKTTLGCC
jgi:hypothetical protein